MPAATSKKHTSTPSAGDIENIVPVPMCKDANDRKSALTSPHPNEEEGDKEAKAKAGPYSKDRIAATTGGKTDERLDLDLGSKKTLKENLTATGIPSASAKGDANAQVTPVHNLTDKIFSQVDEAHKCGKDLKPKAVRGTHPDLPSNKVTLPSSKVTQFGTGWAHTGHPVEYEHEDAHNRQLPASLYAALPGMCVCSPCSVRDAQLT